MHVPYLERPGVSCRKEFKRAAEYLKSNYRVGDLVLHTCENSTLPIEYYLNSEREFLNSEAAKTNKFAMDCFIKNRGKQFLVVHEIERHGFFIYKDIGSFILQDEDCLIKAYKRIWLILSSWEATSNFRVVKNWFSQNYQLENAKEFNGVGIFLYKNPLYGK
jgi:hypothetical protein